MYVTELNQELDAFREELRKADFTSWITCRARCWWKEEFKVRRDVFFRPMVDLAIQNLSQDMDFEAMGEIQFVDPAGRVGTTAKIRISCAHQDTAIIHAEGEGLCKQEDVWVVVIIDSKKVATKKKVWKARVLIENRYFGEFSIP